MTEDRTKKRDKHPYIKVRPKDGGPWCFCETQAEAKDLMDSNIEDEYETAEVWMSQTEWEALPEFEGW